MSILSNHSPLIKYCRRFIYYSFIAVTFGFLTYACQTTSKTASGNVRDSGRNSIREAYSRYNSLESSFKISGIINKSSFTYMGKIQIANEPGGQYPDVSMSVHDPVFQSILFRLQVKSGMVNYRDYLQNRNESFEYEGSRIQFLSSYSMPATAIIPVFSGMLPEGLLEKGLKAEDSDEYTFQAEDYRISGIFTGNLLSELTFQNKEGQPPIIVRMQGVLDNPMNRHFPKQIRIDFPDKSYLQIDYKNVTIK